MAFHYLGDTGEDRTKVKIDTDAFGYPMPTALMGSLVEKKPAVLAAAWVTRVHFALPMIAVARERHYINRGIEEHTAFSENVSDVGLLEKTDFCGRVAGEKTDKVRAFDVFYGEAPHAPLIKECPVCMHCPQVD